MKQYLNTLIEIENRLILERIQSHLKGDFYSAPKELYQIFHFDYRQKMFLKRNISNQIHASIIEALIFRYISSRFPQEDLSFILPKNEYVRIELPLIDAFEISEIPNVIESFHIEFLKSEFVYDNNIIDRCKSKNQIKENGVVYTLSAISKEMVANCIHSVTHIDVKELTCLDFGCGTGRFYFEAVRILHEECNLEFEQIICKNLYAVDRDEVAVSILRCRVLALFYQLNEDIITAIRENIVIRNVLIDESAEFEDEESRCIDLKNDFQPILSKGGFRIVFSNPPYRLLKVNKKGSNGEGYFSGLQQRVQKEIEYFRRSDIYIHSVQGMLNYYQLSIEMILRLTNKDGQIGIICPSSLFADLTSSNLRKHLILKHKIQFIRYYPESARLFEDITQSTVIFYLQKNGKTDIISIESGDEKFDIALASVQITFPTNWEIPRIGRIGWNILSKLSRFPKIKDYDFIRNKRGELDLTLYKQYITLQNTGWRLVRGNMISIEGIKDKNYEFVNVDDFIKKKSTDFRNLDFNRVRLVCQQISNMQLHQRLKFVFANANDILANSCNYLVSTRSHFDLIKLQFLLNSDLLNWRFKISSSNNHINNYELDELPIADLDSVILDKFVDDANENNRLICQMYGLDSEETEYILKTNKQKELILSNEFETA